MLARLVTRLTIEERMMQQTKKKMVLEHLVVHKMNAANDLKQVCLACMHSSFWGVLTTLACVRPPYTCCTFCSSLNTLHSMSSIGLMLLANICDSENLHGLHVLL